MKAQLRAGKWTISLNAFRVDDQRQFSYAEQATPTTDRELVAFISNPQFRLAEITGLPSVDISQTTIPQKWRGYPVYQWDTATPIVIEQKMRGMGLQEPEGLNVNRQIWLDENGAGFTYSDHLYGQQQRLWRLDTASGQELGAVRVNGKGQLITTNPVTGDQGVEIRTRNLDLEAIGRINVADQIAATGWQVDAASLGVTLNLPPGWRVLALFGADRVDGDWLTAWSLLDLFLLLIFGVAAFRLWGWQAGIIAFLAFGLAYHEYGSPRLTWLFLLIPVALLRVVPEGSGQKWIRVWKYLAIALLVIHLVPFLGRQIQEAIYPQLERPGINFASRDLSVLLNESRQASAPAVMQTADEDWYQDPSAAVDLEGGQAKGRREQSKFSSQNLLYDPKAKIQTGPAEPEWQWNRVRCDWDGPVTSTQEIRPILISRQLNRVLIVLRMVLLLLLTAMVTSGKLWPFRLGRKSRHVAAAIAVIGALQMSGQALAQDIPDADMLEVLRERLLEADDAFPTAADIPAVQIRVTGNRIVMDAEIHTAHDVAVPLPGRLPPWSPVTVAIDGQSAEYICRRNNYLWAYLPAGVHRVRVESMIPEVTEWEWTFVLRPRTVVVDADDWNVTGVRSNGVPEQQVFFSRKQAVSDGTAAYDRKDFHALVAVDRHVETGLEWQVRNVVSRLENITKPVSIRVPLLPGEKVLTSNVVVNDGAIEVRLGADEESFTWNSGLTVGQEVELRAAETDQFVERWHLVTSPVWNMSREGLDPIFEAGQENLMPVWQPWPGESVKLTFSEPNAVAGETMTVQRVEHQTTVGGRQRSMHLQIAVDCSLGGDFPIGLDPAAQITSVMVEGKTIPVRRDGADLIVPVRPGKQDIEVAWRTNKHIEPQVRVGAVQLPVEAANITSVVNVPESRWVLWAAGPTRGPAVRFWIILALAILVALVLGSMPMSPLGRVEWVLLAIGLTQVHVVAALLVVAWLFLMARRGRTDPESLPGWLFNLGQVSIVLLTLVSLGILIVVVGAGLLGHPEMFIIGNGSYQTHLVWFQPTAGIDQSLPGPTVVTISVWFYRLMMLFWALWLAFALLRWLSDGWKHFSRGGLWDHFLKTKTDSETSTSEA